MARHLPPALESCRCSLHSWRAGVTQVEGQRWQGSVLCGQAWIQKHLCFHGKDKMQESQERTRRVSPLSEMSSSICSVCPHMSSLTVPKYTWWPLLHIFLLIRFLDWRAPAWLKYSRGGLKWARGAGSAP